MNGLLSCDQIAVYPRAPSLTADPDGLGRKTLAAVTYIDHLMEDGREQIIKPYSQKVCKGVRRRERKAVPAS